MTFVPPSDTEFIRSLIPVLKRSKPKRWKSPNGKRLYEWDGLHGELEVYNGRGEHLGVVDVDGRHIKDAKPGRCIDV